MHVQRPITTAAGMTKLLCAHVPSEPSAMDVAMSVASRVTDLTQQLIRIPSITPKDGGCQALLQQRLERLGFSCETLVYGDVTNLWAVRPGNGPSMAVPITEKDKTVVDESVGHSSNLPRPLVVFAGHTDVVPTGPESEWTFPPFAGTVHKDAVHGRGAVDMKGGIASFVTALEDFVAQHDRHEGSIGILLTSDEEGDAVDGTKQVVQELVQKRGVVIDAAIVGEPSSKATIGDIIKIGRRGSLGGELTIRGVQGHVAYPEHSINPIHESLGALKELVDMEWDTGTDDFGPTTFQITNIASGTGATNVVPGFKRVVFNFRFSPASTPESIQARVRGVLDRHNLQYEMHWDVEPTLPYETDRSSPLIEAARDSVHDIVQIEPNTCTSGGTSDGRFLAAHGAHVVELGLVSRTIHKIDEHVPIGDLVLLARIYQTLLERLLVLPLVTEEEKEMSTEQEQQQGEVLQEQVPTLS